MSINAPNSSDPWIGRRLGDEQRYRLDRRLGGGAVGDVYLAMDVRLGRRVAIKILKGALARSKELLARFEREVALSVALESEHIVQVIDYGVAPGEHPFYVMEYLQGQTLSQFLGRKGRLSVEQTITIANQLCAGLKVAHEGVLLWKNQATDSERVKIIHRDLKPANIFLVNTALGELAKILDFGIAKKLHTSQQAEQTNLTQAFLGTFRYAAPEQLRNASKLDERADIYSLGIILYEMLSGSDPFGILTKAHSQKAHPQVEMSWAMAHTAVEPTPLRQQPGCENLPVQLEAVVMRCLGKRAGDRFASVVELSQSLNAISLTTHSTASQPSSSVPDETLDSTVIRPLALSQEAPTLYRPIASQPASSGSYASDQPIDPTSAMAESNFPNNTPDYTIVQSPAASKADTDQASVNRSDTKLETQEGTIVQHPYASQSFNQSVNQSAIQPTNSIANIAEPSKDSHFQSPAAVTPPADGTVVQNPHPRNYPDSTIAQIPSQPTPPPAANRDATIFQSPKATPTADATLFQGLPAQGAASPRRPSKMPPVPSSSQPREGRSPDPAHHSPSSQGQGNGLFQQAEGWLRSSASNYTDRIRAQAQAEIRHGAYRFVARLLPMGVGFAFGLAAMSGAYYIFRSKLPNLPLPGRPSPTIFK